MTRKQKIGKEIDFANQGAGAYLFCCLWDMMEDHEVTVWDFHDQTDAWKEAVVGCACEAYEHIPYEELWDKIICTSFVEREEHDGIAKETAENIKKFLIDKIDKFLDKTVTEYSDHLKGGMKTKQSVLLHCLLSSGHELSIKDMDFANVIGDGLVFNSEGRIEQGCGKEDCCQSN